MIRLRVIIIFLNIIETFYLAILFSLFLKKISSYFILCALNIQPVVSSLHVPKNIELIRWNALALAVGSINGGGGFCLMRMRKRGRKVSAASALVRIGDWKVCLSAIAFPFAVLEIIVVLGGTSLHWQPFKYCLFGFCFSYQLLAQFWHLRQLNYSQFYSTKYYIKYNIVNDAILCVLL